MSYKAPPQPPQINLNGSSYKQLWDPLMAALNALEAAQTALGKTAPHGRDYLPQGGENYKLALEHHTYRMVTLTNLVAEYETIILALEAQQGARTK